MHRPAPTKYGPVHRVPCDVAAPLSHTCSQVSARCPSLSLLQLSGTPSEPSQPRALHFYFPPFVTVPSSQRHTKNKVAHSERVSEKQGAFLIQNSPTKDFQ
ncbi:hypothetical protein VZT92_024759 [Zoarces viviparus]|uniref:Uncharacterized protein n=1 Tax=Zoarces viviparus TaxID=48416 RepID=A0AAW1E3R3_ZOAVI